MAITYSDSSNNEKNVHVHIYIQYIMNITKKKDARTRISTTKPPIREAGEPKIGLSPIIFRTNLISRPDILTSLTTDATALLSSQRLSTMELLSPSTHAETIREPK